MAGSSSPDWIKFFTAAGIPSRYAAKYAVTFNDHRIQEDMLKDLNKEILYDMGIKTMGDVIAIMRHAKEVDEERSRAKVLGGRNGDNAPEAVVKRQVKRIVSVEERADVVPATAAPATATTALSRRLGPTAGAASLRKVEAIAVREPVVKRIIVGETAAQERVVRLSGTGSGSVFERLGGTAPSAATGTGGGSTLVSGSALRSLSLTAAAMQAAQAGAKATATVRPTRGTPYSVKDRLGGKGASMREVVSSNLKLKSDPAPTASRTQIVSLKRSIFDRLGS